MKGVRRMTLFIHDRECGPDCLPQAEQLQELLRQSPMVVRNTDGSRTFVFDLPEPEAELDCAPFGGGQAFRRLN
jgi:hypothetical protein